MQKALNIESYGDSLAESKRNLFQLSCEKEDSLLQALQQQYAEVQGIGGLTVGGGGGGCGGVGLRDGRNQKLPNDSAVPAYRCRPTYGGGLYAVSAFIFYRHAYIARNLRRGGACGCDGS